MNLTYFNTKGVNILQFVRIVGIKDTETNKCYNRGMDGFLDPSKYNL